jgi:hypothetical protein
MLKQFILGMKPLELRLQDYLEDLVGERPALERLPADQTDSLPLHLRERYHLVRTRLFGRPWILALSSPDWEPGSALEYADHVSRLSAATGGGAIVVVLPTVPSWSRNRLVRAGVPFIVPGRQMFLPPYAVDLREHMPSPKKVSARPLTPAAQAVFLRHLLKENLNDLPLREIAPKTGYSAMMMTKVKHELESGGLCEVTRRGRSLVLQFPTDHRLLWEKAEPRLSSPVRKAHWVRWPTPGYPALVAGITALSHRTLIEEDSRPTYALPEATFRTNLERGLFHGCPDPSEADVLLEAWTYNPLLLGDNKEVDPLSLYLSLRDTPDERVRQQLESLLEQVPW